MSFVQSILGQVVGTVLQLITLLISRDRRSLVLDRRAKVLALAKEMKVAGISPHVLRTLERQLTKEP